MDIYVGGTRASARSMRPAVEARVSSAGLPHRDAGLGSEFVAVWTDGDGEAICAETDALEILFDGYLHRHGAPTLQAHLPVLAEPFVGLLHRLVLVGPRKDPPEIAGAFLN